MNKVIIVGNLTKDPELSQTNSGISVCRLSVAVSRQFTDGEGNRQTDFFNVVVWRGKADNCGKYLKKGRKVGIVGNLQNRSYDDKDGVKRYVTEIIAEDVEFLSSHDNQSDGENTVTATRKRPELEPVDEDSDLPF